jgi:hypothetical protein
MNTRSSGYNMVHEDGIHSWHGAVGKTDRHSGAVTVRPIWKSNGLIENQPLNLPASSSVPQITTLPLDPRFSLYVYFLMFKLHCGWTVGHFVGGWVYSLSYVRIFQIYTSNSNWEFVYWCYYISLYHYMFSALRAILRRIQYVIFFILNIVEKALVTTTDPLVLVTLVS